MRIKRISEIKNFSIFKNFNWSESLSNYDFKDINILYGRNYSGKTSLSKIIKSLEKKALPPKYDNPNFTIQLQDDSEINQSTLSNFEHPIHVYNSDFVKENLKFIHDEDANIKSFSVTLGGDNQQILDRIQELKNELGSNEENSETGLFLDIINKTNEVKTAEANHQSKYQHLETLLTDEATRKSNSIKNQHVIFGDINYNVGKLKREIISVQNTNFKVLTDIQIAKNKELIAQRELDNPPDVSTYTLNFSSLIQSIDETLKTVVGGSNKIPELTQDNLLNQWVQTGHQLHHERTTCAFCNNQISNERRDELRHHFDEETQKLQARISKGIKHLVDLLESDNLNISFDINLYYQQYHDELSQLTVELQTILDRQKVSIKQLKTLLEEKNGQLFTEIQVTYPSDYSEEINSVLGKIAQIRNACIQLNSGLTKQQTEAKSALRLNYIYHFLQDINYTSLQTEIEALFQAIDLLTQALIRLNTRKTEINAEIKSEEDQLKSEGEACTRINNILNHDFGHQSLSLKAIENPHAQNIYFEIQRNGSKAHNLSEGEQSLISFCYFLAKIQDDLDQDKKPIIWIDDPICSLDSDHIFFIYSLIEEKICKNKKFLQLFISTHNLEFLKYLRRISGVETDNAIATVKEQNRKTSYFLIQRYDSFSIIRKMPLYLSKFLTEFNYLFDQIYKCASAQKIDDSNYSLFYNFGNNARKFLEIYTFYKFPSPKYSLDNQLKIFWGEDIYKTLSDRIHNEYSHMTGILERGGCITEQPEMQKSAKAIIKKVQEDIEQYNALLDSIDVEQSLDTLHPNNQNENKKSA